MKHRRFMTTQPDAAERLALLLELVKRARAEAANESALRFVAVNDTHLLTPYHQAALYQEGRVVALSGLTQPEANTAYVRWLELILPTLPSDTWHRVTPSSLPPLLSADWSQWLPAHVLWIPAGTNGDGLLCARDDLWTDADAALLREWMATWSAFQATSRRRHFQWHWRTFLRSVLGVLRRRPILFVAIAIVASLVPVRLSVLAPGELVAINPLAIRAPIDGVIERFHVQTNERVTEQQPLFSYDRAYWTGRLAVAEEGLRSAEAEERQQNLRALQDSRARSQLALARSVREERRIEVEYLREQLTRADVVAPRDGVVLMDDPAEWIGRPVGAGQRILRLVEPEVKEVEIWLPVGDAIVLPAGAEVRLYLHSSPLRPVTARVRSVAFEAVRRPEGTFAYRILATIDGSSSHRIGLKGTARLHGSQVPLIYWMLRRPLAWLRGFSGL